MSGQFKILQTLIVAGIASAAPAALTQSSELGTFALSLHEHLVQSTTQTVDTGSFMDVHMIDFEAQVGSIVVLLTPPADDQSGSDGIGGFSGADFADQRGSSIQGIDARDSFAPKSDPLTVVPLPPAAFAGMVLLAGVAGVRYFRRVNR